MDVLRTHPTIIIKGTLQENLFFVPPEGFLRELREPARRRRRRRLMTDYHESG